MKELVAMPLRALKTELSIMLRTEESNKVLKKMQETGTYKGRIREVSQECIQEFQLAIQKLENLS